MRIKAKYFEFMIQVNYSHGINRLLGIGGNKYLCHELWCYRQYFAYSNDRILNKRYFICG